MEQRARIDDTKLAYEVIGKGDRLVWCHGLASCRDGDRDVIDAFAGAGFSVLAYDARGHGRSSPVHEADRYSYPRLADDLVALMNVVGWSRAILTGASMGAATIARVAVTQPDMVAALVLARPGAVDDQGLYAPMWLQLLFAGGGHAIRNGGIDGAIAYLRSIPMAAELLEREPQRLEGLRTDWGRHDPLSIAAALEGVPRTTPLEGGVRAEDIACPTLVIPGNDVIHPTEAGVRAAARIPGAQLAPAFDSLPRDQEIAGLVRLVREFLRDSAVRA